MAQEPEKVLVFYCDGGEVVRVVNKMLKPHGLKIKVEGRYVDLGDQRYLSIIPIEVKEPKDKKA